LLLDGNLFFFFLVVFLALLPFWSAVCLLFLPLLYYFKYIDAKLHIINERYEEIVENYLKIIDDGRFNDDKPTETLEEAQRYR